MYLGETWVSRSETWQHLISDYCKAPWMNPTSTTRYEKYDNSQHQGCFCLLSGPVMLYINMEKYFTSLQFQIFWIIPILSITFLSRNVCFITMKFIHTIWHSLLWHISLAKKHGWLERHGNPSCATHPLKMANFPSHVRFPEGIPPKTNSHFSDPRFSSIWRIQNHLPFLGFVSSLGFRCKKNRPQALPHEEDLVDVPRDVSKRWAWAWNFAICSYTSVRNRYHQKMTFSNSLFHFWYVRFSLNSLCLVTIWATYLLIT